MFLCPIFKIPTLFFKLAIKLQLSNSPGTLLTGTHFHGFAS